VDSGTLLLSQVTRPVNQSSNQSINQVALTAELLQGNGDEVSWKK